MRITDKYVFFWGSIYSQWYICEFEVDGLRFNCAEQYMMYRKAMLFGDTDIAAQIMRVKAPYVPEKEIPRRQKELGQMVKNFDKAVWEENCREIVYKGNHAKFTQNHELLVQFLGNGKRAYVEASPFDKIWGIGMKEYDKGVENPTNWKGTNWLGEELTRLCKDLKMSDFSLTLDKC